jgi:hypothetical protein
MVTLTLRWDTSKIEHLKNHGLERALFRAVSRAGGDAIRAMRTSSRRSVQFRKRMKSERVQRGLPMFFPRGPRELAQLVWRVGVSGEVVPVSAFPFRQVRRGVSVAINRGKRQIIPGAFVATMRSGHVGVFSRRADPMAAFKSTKRRSKLPARVRRLPIDEAFTTRISDVFGDSGMIPAVHARGQAVFSSAFDRLLALELSRAR